MLDSDAWRLGYFNANDTPEYLLMRSNEERFRDFQKQHWDALNNHFYIIVVPKTLDVLECCLTFLPPNLRLFLILNGLDPWEREFLNRVYPNIPKFVLETNSLVKGSEMPLSFLHDRVLDLLMECNYFNFGIIDQDCFVIDSRFFSRLQIADSEFAISPFSNLNKQSNITFPRTYILLFNTSVIHRIRRQYKLSFKRCWTIPARLEAQLMALNLGYHNFPHDSLDYFDTFQLIWAVALHQGFSFGAGPSRRTLFGRRRYRIIHIGAASLYLTDESRDQMIDNQSKYETLSRLEKEKFGAAAFSYYAHLLLLENTNNSELVEHYGPFFSRFGSSGTILKTFSAVIGPQKVKEMELVIACLRKARRRG